MRCLTLAQAGPYLRMAERAIMVQSAILAFGGVNPRTMPPIPIFPSRKGEQTLGEYCQGERIELCQYIFGCDEPTLERIACRTCPD